MSLRFCAESQQTFVDMLHSYYNIHKVLYIVFFATSVLFRFDMIIFKSPVFKLYVSLFSSWQLTMFVGSKSVPNHLIMSI